MYTFPAAFLSSSSACFDFFRHLYLVSFGLAGISHRVVGVSGGEAVHSRTYGARAAESLSPILDDRGPITGFYQVFYVRLTIRKLLTRLDGTS